MRGFDEDVILFLPLVNLLMSQCKLQSFLLAVAFPSISIISILTLGFCTYIKLVKVLPLTAYTP